MNLTCGQTSLCAYRTLSLRKPRGVRTIHALAFAQSSMRAASPLARVALGAHIHISKQFQNTQFQQVTGLSCHSKRAQTITRQRQTPTCRYSSSPPTPAERIVSILPYLLPFFEGLRYGRFFFQQFPIVTQVFLNPIQPLIQLYFSVPFASLIAFMAIYLGIAKNARFSEFIKFNAFQAILLDICLVFPALLESVFRPPRYGMALQIYSYYQSAIWLVLAAIVVYSVACNIVGRKPVVPYLSEWSQSRMIQG